MPDNTFLSLFLAEDIYLIEGKTENDQVKTNSKYAVIAHLPLSDQDQKFLFKIFASVNISSELLDLGDISKFDHQHPISFFFGVMPPGEDPEYYKIINEEHGKVIVAHSLADIAQDDIKKRDLWKVLKSCFT